MNKIDKIISELCEIVHDDRVLQLVNELLNESVTIQEKMYDKHIKQMTIAENHIARLEKQLEEKNENS